MLQTTMMKAPWQVFFTQLLENFSVLHVPLEARGAACAARAARLRAHARTHIGRVIVDRIAHFAMTDEASLDPRRQLHESSTTAEFWMPAPDRNVVESRAPRQLRRVVVGPAEQRRRVVRDILHRRGGWTNDPTLFIDALLSFIARRPPSELVFVVLRFY